LHGCNRYGGTCTGGTDDRNKFHAGIDIKSSYGNPIYAMYDGFIYSSKFHKKAGWNIRVQSTVNGKTILVSYFHLQKENRLLVTNPLNYVKAGDIIGYQGDSGNLKGAIKSGGVESHVHIEIREHNGSSKWGYKNFNLVDPRTYFSTTIKDDGTSEDNTNCN
jgi:murein DD-endopeptidase MepM/ murein hydrolase activator NlpD